MKLKTLFVAVLMAVVFAFCGCGNKGPSSYWECKKQVWGEGDSQVNAYYVSELSFGSSSVKVDQIWVNVSGLKVDEINVEFIFSNSSTSTTSNFGNTTSSYYRSAKVTKNAVKESKREGWLKLDFGKSLKDYSFRKVLVGVTDEIKFNEIVFVNFEGEKIELSLMTAGIRDASGSNTDVLTKEEIESKGAKNSALNICDEQDAFNLDWLKED